VRSPSEVEYTAVMKMKMGRKLKDGETWRMEDGWEEEWERLERFEVEVREENARRRSASVEGAMERSASQN